MTFEQDPDLAAELRRGVGRDIAEEAAEDERMTAAYDRRRFDMATVAKEMANRGDRVTVVASGHTYSGLVVAAGSDHVTVEGSGQRADVRLDAGFWSIFPGNTSGLNAPVTEETMRARLAEHAEAGGIVRVALANGEIVIGRIDQVAVDHLELVDADGRTLYVPTGLVLAVVRPSDAQ